MRIGHGFDVHAFGPGEFITMGGVRIPHSHGLIAHSDGDVLLHALCDALLGAAGLGDIGQHFPDSSAEFKGINSRILLRPPHIPAMREHIAADLALTPDRINVKATTTERLGYIGRGEGIAVHAVALVV